jgi:hypothetical protein
LVHLSSDIDAGAHSVGGSVQQVLSARTVPSGYHRIRGASASGRSIGKKQKKYNFKLSLISAEESKDTDGSWSRSPAFF